ncbi:GNAT family N-acetyltransferase [Streptomyces sp. NPDC005805]|uniref:GNAT family N-acetyltransferase n=1 Tax=Streptomyces sp. NPDC005805 TaxID=3157068 RepID=UPI0033E60F97
MTVIVRDFRPEDGAAVTRVRRAALPFDVTTPESLAFSVRTAHPDKRFRLLVAEEDGEIVGAANVGVAYEASEPGLSFANPVVDPAHRGRGAGGLLLRTAEEHLAAAGAVSLFSWVEDTPASRAFAEKRGYRPSRPAHFLHLDLTSGTLPEPPALPPGAELRTAADYEDDPRPMFLADAEATSDEPSDVGADFSDYEDWIRHTWENPLLDRTLSSVVVVDGEVAAFTAALTDRETRYWSGMTGTARTHRGRGYARIAKSDSLRRARTAGLTDAYTSNDADNGPMLAVNTWFGYRVCASEVRYVRSLV